MGFFKKIKRAILPTVGAILGSAILPGVGTALGSGLGSLASGADLKGALLSAGGAYAGSAIGGNLFGAGGSVGNLGTVGSLLSGASNVGPQFISGIGTNLGAILGNAQIGSVLGGFAGSQYAENAMKDSEAKPQQLPAAAGPDPFKPKQEAEKALPSSLSGFASLTPEQRTSALATQGVYGGGIGPQEQEYFLNQMNRKLVDPMGSTSDISGLAPIERSYLERLGLGGYGNTSSLLEAMSKWSYA